MDYSRDARTHGNPNQRDTDREAARLGRQRVPEDIPKQDSMARKGVVPGNVNAALFQSSTLETGGSYRIGSALRPNIIHDNGHLVLGTRTPTATDYLKLAKWKAMVEGAEMLRSDLSDGLAAYRHFLEGRGKPRVFSYERYVTNDNSGRTTLRNAILDLQDAAIKLWQSHSHLRKFNITGPAIPCGSDPSRYPYLSTHFPYPATENWQKAIGGHMIWLSGELSVIPSPHATPSPLFELTMILHAEDRYNFNPGQQDIATGIPDSENGLFAMTGLAHQYNHFSTLTRQIEWRGTSIGVLSCVSPNTVHMRQPRNNRRIRNRI